MRIAVTGATSFVGAAAVRRMLAGGHQVIALVRPHSDKRFLVMENQEQALMEKRLLIAENDLFSPETIPETVLAALREEKTPEQGEIQEGRMECDVFCHFGWGGSGSGSREDRELQERNLQAALETIRAAEKLGCRKFLFSGSQAEYGMHTETMDEAAECRPRSVYGEAKLAVRHQGEELCRSLGMQYVHGRIFSVYGPGDHSWTLVESCLSAFLNGQELDMGACTQKWNFLYIDDLAEAVYRLISKPVSEYGSLQDPVFNLAGTETRLLRDFVEEIRRLCGGSGYARYGVRPENAEGPVNLIPDISKLCSFTGWKPEMSFENGIRQMISEKKGKNIDKSRNPAKMEKAK